MYHTLRFRQNHELDLQVPGRPRLEKVLVHKGDRIEAQLRPFVREEEEGPVEMADLYLNGGGALLAVPMAAFCFE